MNQNALAQMGKAALNELQGQQITLADGRRRDYAHYGAPDGTPALFFHGSLG